MIWMVLESSAAFSDVLRRSEVFLWVLCCSERFLIFQWFFLTFWGVLRRSNAFWNALNSLRRFWSVFWCLEAFHGCSLEFWVVQKGFWMFRGILRRSEVFWGVMRHNHRLWVFLKGFLSSWWFVWLLAYSRALWGLSMTSVFFLKIPEGS